MADLQGDDVTAFTAGRLDGDDDEVIRMLNAALQVARRHCKWHVSPVRIEDPITLDGPDSRILWLPTMKPIELVSAVEDGVTLDVSTISISAGNGEFAPRAAAARKKSKAWWTDQYGGIVLELTHGFTEDEAADWRQAVLSMVDQMSQLPVKAATGVSAFGQTTLRVDDVQLGYGNPYAAMAQEVLFSVANILCDYELPSAELV